MVKKLENKKNFCGIARAGLCFAWRCEEKGVEHLHKPRCFLSLWVKGGPREGNSDRFFYLWEPYCDTVEGMHNN
jgi:hypothetical protein